LARGPVDDGWEVCGCAVDEAGLTLDPCRVLYQLPHGHPVAASSTRYDRPMSPVFVASPDQSRRTVGN